MSRRFQFSLKSLLAAVLVASVFLGGTRFGERRESQRRRLQEERELAEYGQVGPTIHISYSYPDKPKDGGTRKISELVTQIMPSDDEPRPGPEFSIRTLLWLTLVVAAFLGGIVFEKERAKRKSTRRIAAHNLAR